MTDHLLRWICVAVMVLLAIIRVLRYASAADGRKVSDKVISGVISLSLELGLIAGVVLG